MIKVILFKKIKQTHPENTGSLLKKYPVSNFNGLLGNRYIAWAPNM